MYIIVCKTTFAVHAERTVKVDKAEAAAVQRNSKDKSKPSKEAEGTEDADQAVDDTADAVQDGVDQAADAAQEGVDQFAEGVDQLADGKSQESASSLLQYKRQASRSSKLCSASVHQDMCPMMCASLLLLCQVQCFILKPVALPNVRAWNRLLKHSPMSL